MFIVQNDKMKYNGDSDICAKCKTSDSDMEVETAIRAKLFRGETEQVRKVIENQKRAMK